MFLRMPFRRSSWVLTIALLIAFVLATAIANAQTVYDRIAESGPRNVFVLYSGADSEYAAKDVATNIATKKKWKVSPTGKDRVVLISYREFAAAAQSNSKDSTKLIEAFSDTKSTIVVMDCSKDSGTLPEPIYGELRRLGGPVPLRRSDDQRLVRNSGKPELWSNLRAFSGTGDNVDNSAMVFVVAADALEDIEQLKSRFGEAISADRLPIYPDTPLTDLRDYPVAVLPVRVGVIDEKLAPASAYMSERIASLLASLGMRQVDRGQGLDAVLNEAQRQERGEFTAEDGQNYGSRLGADIVATGVIRKFDLNRAGNVLDRRWECSVELSIKLLSVKTGEVIYDSGAIRGNSRSRSGLSLTTVIGANSAKAGDPSLWGGLESDAIRSVENALRSGLFIFEMGLRGKSAEIGTKMQGVGKSAGSRIDWNALRRDLGGVKFGIRIPETIIRRVVPDPAVETGLMRTMTQAGLDLRDPGTVKSVVDDAMVDRLLKGSIGAGDRRKVSKSLGADVLITGEAFAVILGPSPVGSSAQARTEIKVISLRTGRVLAADSREVTQQAASEEVAGKRALERTAQVLSDDNAFWTSLARNLEQDKREWGVADGSRDDDQPGGNPQPRARLNGMTFMVAMQPGRGVDRPFINQLETAAGSQLMDSGAEVLDPSRAEELKRLSTFQAVADGSSSNYLELKAACPADVLIIGQVDATAGARGSAMQVSWKAIWMSNGKLIGTGSEIGFLESADPAEQAVASKDVAAKLIDNVSRTVSRNKPENRDFTIEVQRLASLTQANTVKKALVGAFPRAPGTFRAGTLRITVPGAGLNRESLALKLERIKVGKQRLKVLSSDASSVKAVLAAGAPAAGGGGGMASLISPRAKSVVKRLKAKGMKFAVYFPDRMPVGSGGATSQELALATLLDAGLPIVDAGILRSRLSNDAFADLLAGKLTSGTLGSLRAKYQGFTILSGMLEGDGGEGAFGRGSAVDLRTGRITAVLPNTALAPLPSDLPAELMNKERSRRIASILDRIIDRIGKAYGI